MHVNVFEDVKYLATKSPVFSSIQPGESSLWKGGLLHSGPTPRGREPSAAPIAPRAELRKINCLNPLIIN